MKNNYNIPKCIQSNFKMYVLTSFYSSKKLINFFKIIFNLYL